MTVQFERIDKHVRAVFPQFGGGTILGDECKCRVDYPKAGFQVIPSLDCPVDEHKQAALNAQQEPEISTSDAQQCKTTK